MKGLQTHKKAGFNLTGLHTKREPHPVTFLRGRAPFWIATLSLFTFVVGNMMGQHGWYGFWASVLGEEDNTAVAYVGTVSPFEKVVDYECWAKFGGDWKVHTFRQAPQKCLRDMPPYTANEHRDSLYSMQFMSSYQHTTEHTGTHAGVDVRVPTGTPVRAVMNGRVIAAGEQPRGFGIYVVLEHPEVPDPENPSHDTETLYTTYAHLSARYVDVGEIVPIGTTIGLSGATGNVTGPHLHFSMEREGAPYYPYYPSSMADGYTYSVSPMLYVQSNYNLATPTTVVASDRTNEVVDPKDVVAPRRVDEVSAEAVVARSNREPASITEVIARLQSRRQERLRERLALLENSEPTVAIRTGVTEQVVVAPVDPKTLVQTDSETSGAKAGRVDTVEVSHDGSFTGRGWEKVTVRLLDADGNVVITPRLDTDLVLRTEFGSAEFRPAILSPLDFFKGEATVNVLPRGRRTVVIKVMPYGHISAPLRYEQ